MANDTYKKCHIVARTECFVEFQQIYQVISCHSILQCVSDDSQCRMLIIMQWANQVWQGLSCICLELRLMLD